MRTCTVTHSFPAALRALNANPLQASVTGAGGAQAPQQESRASCRPDEHGRDDPGGAAGAPVLRSGRNAAEPPPAAPLVPSLQGGSSAGDETQQPTPGNLAAEGGMESKASVGDGAASASESRGQRHGSGAAAGGEADDEAEPVLRRGRRLLSMLSGSGRLSSGRLPSVFGAGGTALVPLLCNGGDGSRSGGAGRQPGERGEGAASPFCLGAAKPKPGCTCGLPKPGAAPPDGPQGGLRGGAAAPGKAVRPDLKRLSGGKARLGAAGGFWLAFPDAALERQFVRYLAAQQLQARALPGLVFVCAHWEAGSAWCIA